MALAALSEVKAHLGISEDDTSNDTALTFWLKSAISAVINFCGTTFEKQTRTEYYQPDGNMLVLRNRPVVSITSIYEDANGNWNQTSGAYDSATLLTAGVDYALVEDYGSPDVPSLYLSRSGMVKRIGKMWARMYPMQRISGISQYALTASDVPAIGSVKVTYVSGYVSVPHAITQAVCWEVDAYRSRQGKGGASLEAESLGEYSYKMGQQQQQTAYPGGIISVAAANLLTPFRMLGNGLAI